MKYAAILMLLIAPLAHAGDTELNIGILSDMTTGTFAKIGSAWGFDFQDTKPNKDDSFGFQGGKWSPKVFYAGPTYAYSVGPFCASMGAVATHDHGATKMGLTPELQYQYKAVTIDLDWLESNVHATNGLMLALGY